MGKKDRRVTRYIADSAPFAQPILKHLRQLIHDACPEIEETIKWGFPNFLYRGILCNIAAFQQHCSFGFWKAALMSDPRRMFPKKGDTSMGDFGRITSLPDLPADKIIISYIQEAMLLNEDGTGLPRPQKTDQSRSLTPPEYFLEALRKNRKANETFERFSYSKKKEYVEWVEEAKTGSTRAKRLTTSIEWLAEGKSRNWKYARK